VGALLELISVKVHSSLTFGSFSMVSCSINMSGWAQPSWQAAVNRLFRGASSQLSSYPLHPSGRHLAQKAHGHEHIRCLMLLHEKGETCKCILLQLTCPEWQTDGKKSTWFDRQCGMASKLEVACSETKLNWSKLPPPQKKNIQNKVKLFHFESLEIIFIREASWGEWDRLFLQRN
jgi:hypothetical protein